VTFTWHGVELDYCTQDYNDAALNERTVEVPIAQHFVTSHRGLGLEVGAVLQHYGPVGWPVIDRYETGEGIINSDVFEWDVGADWIVAISTLEHVRWDEEPREEGGSVKAIAHLRSLLRPGGAMLVTVPFGVNMPLDEAILFHEVGACREATFLRDGDHGWREAHRPDAWKPYGPRWANAVWVGEWSGSC
jgi:hypothetical protein